VGNAIKFTGKGEVVVHAAVAEETAGGVVVRFEVTDTGIGMAPEVRARLFQPFTQGDGSTTRKYGGTGLGLAISKQLTELMGGQTASRASPAGAARSGSPRNWKSRERSRSRRRRPAPICTASGSSSWTTTRPTVSS
jgi:signal transduction histidine kinase